MNSGFSAITLLYALCPMTSAMSGNLGVEVSLILWLAATSHQARRFIDDFQIHF
jgi:hypothetical protein